MDPLRQQLQTAIRAMAGALVHSANRLANTRTWGRLSATAAAFETIMAGDPRTLPQRLGDAYPLLLQLGRFLETDIRVQRDRAASDGPLDPDIHGLLTDLVRTAAPWLRGFPTVAAWDDAAGKALVRADLFQPAREFTRIARANQAISERDAAEVERLSETADTRDFQGQKAGNRAVGSAKNLMLAQAGVLAAFLSREDASGFAGKLPLVRRAAATLGDAEAQVKAFVATMQSDLAQALQALVMESRSLDVSTFEAARGTATDQSAAKRKIKAHLPKLAVDGGEGGLTNMALSREEIEARCKRIDEAGTDDFARLVELAGLDTARNLRRADWSDVSFRNSDIRGFDFTAARLHNCDFTAAQIAGARFVQAELGAVLHHGRDNPREPARMTGIANLRAAADWAANVASFADPQRWKQPAELYYPSHLPVGAIFSDLPGLAPEMVVVPAGTFLMGSPDGSGGDNGDQAEEDRFDNEGPRRRVAFDRPFAIGRFAVTVAEFRAFAAAEKRRGKVGDSRQVGAGLKPAPTEERRGKAGASRQRAKQDDRHPVTEVSWEDVVAYCAWLNARLGLPPNTYRLPSEAEWEYCARAGTDGPFWWEGPISTQKANYNGNYTYGNSPKGEYRGRTLPVDSFAPNPWGLYQVHGNVWEWTQDCYHDSYAGAPSDGSVWTTGDSSRRVLRGGSWDYDPRILRAAKRDRNSTDFRIDDSGFRVGRTLTP